MRTGMIILMASLLAACAPRHKDPEGSGMGSEWQQRQAGPVLAEDALSLAVQASPIQAEEGQRVYRFLLTGHDQQRLDLRISFDGKEVCRVTGRLDAATHAHQYAKGPRVDHVCVIEGPVENEARVEVHMQGFVINPDSKRCEVNQKVVTDFDGFIDGWIEIAEDGQAEIGFPKG